MNLWEKGMNGCEKSLRGLRECLWELYANLLHMLLCGTRAWGEYSAPLERSCLICFWYFLWTFVQVFPRIPLSATRFLDYVRAVVGGHNSWGRCVGADPVCPMVGWLVWDVALHLFLAFCVRCPVVGGVTLRQLCGVPCRVCGQIVTMAFMRCCWSSAVINAISSEGGVMMRICCALQLLIHCCMCWYILLLMCNGNRASNNINRWCMTFCSPFPVWHSDVHNTNACTAECLMHW